MTTDKFTEWLYKNAEDPDRAIIAFDSWKKNTPLETMRVFWKTNSIKIVLRLMNVEGYRPKIRSDK